MTTAVHLHRATSKFPVQLQQIGQTHERMLAINFLAAVVKVLSGKTLALYQTLADFAAARAQASSNHCDSYNCADVRGSGLAHLDPARSPFPIAALARSQKSLKGKRKDYTMSSHTSLLCHRVGMRINHILFPTQENRTLMPGGLPREQPENPWQHRESRCSLRETWTPALKVNTSSEENLPTPASALPGVCPIRSDHSASLPIMIRQSEL